MSNSETKQPLNIRAQRGGSLSFKQQNSSGTGDSDNLYYEDINPVSTKPNNGYENSDSEFSDL
ncbi:hypothetical protein BB558_002961 [Smittium angustum]|uniref:Uncharacterized protein n=1 Tax=Smittium angustum TaxID=133377 RepID=A0A2U1J7B1_SMIAN|nr:hypothetical protein BB558_002961 [Smittium angustum]